MSNLGDLGETLSQLAKEGNLPSCLQPPFWEGVSEQLAEARRAGEEVLKLMDEGTSLQKSGKSPPEDFQQRWKDALKNFRIAFEVCQNSATVLQNQANHTNHPLTPIIR